MKPSELVTIRTTFSGSPAPCSGTDVPVRTVINPDATGSTLAPTFQRGLAAWLERTLTPVVRFFDPIPDFVMGLVLLGLAVGAVILSSRRNTAEPSDTDHRRNDDEPSCHTDTDHDARHA